MGLLFHSYIFDIVTLLVALTLLLVIYAKYVFNFWKKQQIPYMEPSFPFGNTKSLILKREQISVNLKKIYNYFKHQDAPFGGFFFGLRPELMLVSPEIIKKVLVKDFEHFTDKGNYSDEENDPLSAHLFSIGGLKWKNLRVKLTPTFTSGKMKMMFQTLVATGDELHNILSTTARTGEPLDIKEVLARFITDVIGSCAFGIDCNTLKTPNTDFRKYGALIFEPRGLDLLRIAVADLSPSFMKFFKIRGLNADLSDFFMNIVKETVRYREENNVTRKDLFQLLLQLKNNGQLSDATKDSSKPVAILGDGKCLTIEEMAAQCFVFFAAGFETSSTTMTFCLYEMMRNMHIQEKLRNEIVRVLKKYNGEITYDAIMEMKYMDQVINETLRKYPPLAFLFRQCTKDYELPGTKCTLKKGQMIRISILGLHHDPEYYPNPDIFDPERFSDEEKNKRPGYTFIPFGEGPRICIGLRFGLLQTKVGLTILLKNYKLTLNQKTQLPLVMEPKNMILTSKETIWLNVHQIES